MTMTKLASLAGVSVSTVSKAFSGSHEISEEKREHIFRVAREYGCYDKYCKNIYSDAVIAVICPEYKSGVYSETLSLMETEIKKYNGIMIVSSTDFNKEREEKLLTFFSEYSKVDGIISLSNLKSCGKYSVPIVVLGENKNFNSVCISEEKAVNDAIKLLKQNGHKDIAFIGERLTSHRKEEFRSAMRKNGLEVKEEYIITEEARFESAGYKAMNRLFNEGKVPTAILAAYDNIAIGAMKSIYEHGVKIPEDISVIGFDDIKELPYLNVPLSSITAYNEDLCEILVNFIFEIINKKNGDAIKTIKLSKRLIKRESVGKAPRR